MIDPHVSDARLILVTRPQRDKALAEFIRNRPAYDRAADLIVSAFDAASEPVTRRRCTIHDCECYLLGKSDEPFQCYLAHFCAFSFPGACVFVDEFCVPRPEALS